MLRCPCQGPNHVYPGCFFDLGPPYRCFWRLPLNQENGTDDNRRARLHKEVKGKTGRSGLSCPFILYNCITHYDTFGESAGGEGQ